MICTKGSNIWYVVLRNLRTPFCLFQKKRTATMSRTYTEYPEIREKHLTQVVPSIRHNTSTIQPTAETIAQTLRLASLRADMSLPEITTEQIRNLDLPTLKIRSEADLVAWKSSTGYRNYMLFLHRLTDSVVGFDIPQTSDECPSLNPVSPINMCISYSGAI